jgi:hypothetical protein
VRVSQMVNVLGERVGGSRKLPSQTRDQASFLDVSPSFLVSFVFLGAELP